MLLRNSNFMIYFCWEWDTLSHISVNTKNSDTYPPENASHFINIASGKRFFSLGRHIAKTEIEQGFVCNIPDPNLFTPVFRIRFLVVLLSFDDSLYNYRNLLLEALLINFPLNILNF